MISYIRNRVAKILSIYMKKRQKRSVTRILSRCKKTKDRQNTLGENDFVKLQSKYTARDTYKYDKFSCWERGFVRARDIINLKDEYKISNLDVLELCCGDGMLGKILSDYGFNVIQHDICDFRDERARSLEFIEIDLQKSLVLPEKQFDLICSFNSFEHIPNPEKTLSDLESLLRKGGLIYLEFGPLYNSPWGLHAYKTIFIPYVQFLFNEDFIDRKLLEFGVFDLGRRLNQLQPLNKWAYRRFEELWASSGLRVIRKEIGTDLNHLRIIEKYPDAFINRGLNVEELTIQWIRIVLQK